MSFPVPLPSTFMPLPLAIMIPFMGIQSGVMAQQFGMNFQYGKRKISAMSNEEFNKLTPQQMQVDFSNQITGMIPTFEKSLQEMRPFQRMIFIEMIAAFKEAVQLGLDIAGAGLGIDTSVPSIPKDRFAPPPGFEEHPSNIRKPTTQVTTSRRTTATKNVTIIQLSLATGKPSTTTSRMSFDVLKNLERANSKMLSRGSTKQQAWAKLNMKLVQAALRKYFGRED